MEDKDNVKGRIQCILRDADLIGYTVILTGANGIMIKSWLVDLFAGKIHSDKCDISSSIGTSAVNCGISSNKLYFIFVKGHPRSFQELIQLMGILKQRNGERTMKDKLHIFL